MTDFSKDPIYVKWWFENLKRKEQENKKGNGEKESNKNTASSPPISCKNRVIKLY